MQPTWYGFGRIYKKLFVNSCLQPVQPPFAAALTPLTGLARFAANLGGLYIRRTILS